MPLLFRFTLTFDRSLKGLDPQQKKIIGRILEALSTYYASNCQLSLAKVIESRFFYKQLRKPFYEAGVESKIRIVIRREKNVCFAVMAGNHDQIKRFLSNQ